MSNVRPQNNFRMHTRRHLLLFASIAIIPTLAQASEESPVQVVERFHAAFMKQRWLALTAFLHPEDLANAQQALLSQFSDDNRTTRKQIEELYGDGMTVAKLRGVSPEEWINPILAAMNRSLDRSGLKVLALDVLGSIEEGELRHVLYRWQSEAPQMRMSQVEVRTLRQYKGAWRLLSPMDLQISLAGMQRAVQK